MNLPRGLFIISSEFYPLLPSLDRLSEIIEETGRDVTVLPDLPVVSGQYDYVFAATASRSHRDLVPSPADDIHQRVLKTGAWVCWVINGQTIGEDVRVEAQSYLAGGMSAVCVLGVKSPLGPNRHVFVSKDGVSEVMLPDSGDGFWGQIFKMCGQYNVKIDLTPNEENRPE